jgi:RP/EB family microtubule-associated protein
MGESRTELLSWLNELLSTRYTKVEQAGSGKNYQKEK